MSRRAAGTDRQRPLYARVLRLDHLRPGGLLSFVLFEGTIALAVLLSLAELVNSWSVLALPLVVAGFIKVVDLITGVFARVDRARPTIWRIARAEGRSGATGPAVPAPAGRSDNASYRGIASVAVRPTGLRRATNERRFAQSGGLRPADPPKAER